MAEMALTQEDSDQGPDQRHASGKQGSCRGQAGELAEGPQAGEAQEAKDGA